MTINSEIRKVGPFIGNGTASAFPFTFKVFQASDLEVVRLEVSTNVETLLTLNSQYTVTLNVDQDSNPGGTVTLIGGALASGYTLTLTSDVPYLQPTDLTNQGGFYPDVINDALDRATIQIQQLEVGVNRSLKVPVSSTANTELPDPQANDLIGWNSTGDGLTNIDPSTLATVVAYATAYADVFIGDGTTTSWVLTRPAGSLYNLDVSIQGVTQEPTRDYTLSGTTITFTTAPFDTHRVLVKYKEGLPTYEGDAQDIRYVPASGPITDVQTRLRQHDAKLEQTVSIQDFGAVGDGVTDDTLAWINAIAATPEGGLLTGVQGKTYKLTDRITITKSITIDLNNCTMKPTGYKNCFLRNSSAATSSTTLSSGANIGNIQVSVTSATGITVGQWAVIYDPVVDSTNCAAWFWSKIADVSGTTITLDRPVPANYASGTINFDVYNTTSFLDFVEIKNGTIDGTNVLTSGVSLGQGVRLYNVEEVLIENVTFQNYIDSTSEATSSCVIAQSINVSIDKCQFINQISRDQVLIAVQCSSVKITNCYVDSSAFGIAISQTENAISTDNVLQGRLSLENYENSSSSTWNSIRGIKYFGTLNSIIANNSISDYESAVKVEECTRCTVSNNYIRNCSLVTYTGQIALNVSNQISGTKTQYIIVSDNVVENSGGVAIGVSSDSVGKCIISGNKVISCVAYGIYCPVNYSIITDNYVSNWNTGGFGPTYVAVYHNNGATIANNRFNHTLETTSVCIRNSLSTGYKYYVVGNICESANPIGLVLESTGTTTIASGSTSNTITHGLSKTPAVYDITLTQNSIGTNDTGNLYVSTLGATTFIIACRNDPGASGLTIGWRAEIVQPFTA